MYGPHTLGSSMIEETNTLELFRNDWSPIYFDLPKIGDRTRPLIA